MSAIRSGLALLLALAGVLLWPGRLAEHGLVPDFLLLCAVGAGLFGSAEGALAAGIAAGLLGGVASLEPFGLEAALLGAAALLARKVRFYFQADHPAVQGTVAGILALLVGGARLLLAASGGPGATGSWPSVLAGVAATALAAPVVLFLVDAVRLFRGPRAPEGRPQLV